MSRQSKIKKACLFVGAIFVGLLMGFYSDNALIDSWLTFIVLFGILTGAIFLIVYYFGDQDDDSPIGSSDDPWGEYLDRMD